MEIRCVTINLKGLTDGWFEQRAQALIHGLRQHNPDLVCFQEATIRQETPVYHQARVIGRALGLENILFSPYGNPGEMITRDQGGVALATRWPISEARGRRLPPGHRGPTDGRAAIFAAIDSPGGRLGVVTTHLSWRPEEVEIRLMQIGLILGELSRSPWGLEVERFILLGDLNASPNEPVIQALQEQMKDAYRSLHPRENGYTWSKSNPLTKGETVLMDRRIDYVFCDRSATVRKCEIILNQPAPVFPSDHFGVLAELEWE